jgi:hypothetical protein
MYFDYGNDDYWDPPQGVPLGWWTLNLSRFICPDAQCNRPADARGEVAANSTPATAERSDRRAERRVRHRHARHRRARVARRERRAKRRCARPGVQCRAAKIVWK